MAVKNPGTSEVEGLGCVMFTIDVVRGVVFMANTKQLYIGHVTELSVVSLSNTCRRDPQMRLNSFPSRVYDGKLWSTRAHIIPKPYPEGLICKHESGQTVKDVVT